MVLRSWKQLSAISSRARNQIATKPSQRIGTPTVECPRGCDKRKTLQPRSARRKTRKRPSAILVLRRSIRTSVFNNASLTTPWTVKFARQRRQCRSGGRCCRVRLMRNCIEVTIATGHCKGSDAFLPRIPLIPSDANIPFEFKRLQFPVRVCFAMLINKAQGQSLIDSGWSLFTSTLFFTWAVLCWVLTGWLAKESVHLCTWWWD